MTTSIQTPAGWYADPSDAAQYRWFDGNAWTTHVQPAPAVVVPQAAAPAAYGQAAYGQQATPQTGYSLQPTAGGCQQCGAVPALQVKLYGHIGMVILQRFLTYRGRYCRDCGISQFRNVQKQLLLLGWWGFISFFVTIVNVGQNLFTFSRLRSLGSPQNRVAYPAALGSSVFASPGFVVSVILAIAVGAVVLN
ncbi:MAG TPA: DUF2510 domain-containing protein [Acidothermaceae bacterium]|jgi:hypothetical protein|nr:DUF2510 domain-containing protein [Acidothermaceae bacterium]